MWPHTAPYLHRLLILGTFLLLLPLLSCSSYLHALDMRMVSLHHSLLQSMHSLIAVPLTVLLAHSWLLPRLCHSHLLLACTSRLLMVLSSKVHTLSMPSLWWAMSACL